MRLRGAGARARLLLALLLLTATWAISLEPPGHSPATSPQAAVAKTDRHHTTRGRGTAKQRAGNDGSERRQGKRPSSPEKSQSHRASGQQLAAQDEYQLDADAIAAANADDVAALDCGDLMAIDVGDRTYCTHGEDPQPIEQNAPPMGAASAGLQSQALCIDD